MAAAQAFAAFVVFGLLLLAGTMAVAVLVSPLGGDRWR